MAATVLTVAGWAHDAGFKSLGILTTAVQCAYGQPHDELDPEGRWGLGGAAAGDGPGQARAAYAQWQKSEWANFPGHGGWRYLAAAASSAAAAAVVIGRETGEDAAGSVVDAGNALQGLIANVRHITSALTKRDTYRSVSKVLWGAGLLTVAAVMLLRGEKAGEATGTVKRAAVTTAKVVAKVPGKKAG